MTFGSPSFCKSCTNYFLSPNINGAIATEVAVGPIYAKVGFTITFQFQITIWRSKMKSSKSNSTIYCYENDNMVFEYRTLSVMSYPPPPKPILATSVIISVKNSTSGKFYLATRRKFLSFYNFISWFFYLCIGLPDQYHPLRWLSSCKGSIPPPPFLRLFTDRSPPISDSLMKHLNRFQNHKSGTFFSCAQA